MNKLRLSLGNKVGFLMQQIVSYIVDNNNCYYCCYYHCCYHINNDSDCDDRENKYLLKL